MGFARNVDRTCIVGYFIVPVAEDVRRSVDVTICAFCFRTSAGVRMKHDTHSAIEEAMLFMTGAGRECLNGKRLPPVVVESLEFLVAAEFRMCFMPSYVVKNAPAECH